MGETPQGLKGAWEKDEGVKGGGCTVTGNGERHRHAARGAETSGGGWRVVGDGCRQTHVSGALRQESRWEAGGIEREYDDYAY